MVVQEAQVAVGPVDPVVLAHALEEHLVDPKHPTGVNAMEVLDQTMKAAQARDHRSMAATMADSTTTSEERAVAEEALVAPTEASGLSLMAEEDPSKDQDKASHHVDLALAEQTSTSGKDHNRAEIGLEDQDSREDGLNLEDHLSVATKEETLLKDHLTLDQVHPQDPKTMAVIAVEPQKIAGAAAPNEQAALIPAIRTAKAGTAIATVIRAVMDTESEATAAIGSAVNVATVSESGRAEAIVTGSAALGVTETVIVVTAIAITTVLLTVTELSGLIGLTETVVAVAARSPSLKRTR